MGRYAQVENKRVVNVVVAEYLEWCIERLGGNWVVATRDGNASFSQDVSPGMLYDPTHPKKFATDWNEAGLTEQGDANEDGGIYWLYTVQGQAVAHAGKIWTNTLPTGTPNASEPGVANWKTYQAGTRYAVWVQPAGEFDSFPIGFRVQHNGKEWESTSALNMLEPGVGQWSPDPAPPAGIWVAGKVYQYADEVMYMGDRWRCNWGHESRAAWTPKAIAGLWEII